MQPRHSQGEGSTFQATGLNHVALNVSSVPKSRDFYIKHLGLKVIRDGGEDNCFLGGGDDFFLTLFKGDRPGLNHYCYTIKGYDADRVEEKLKAAGLKPDGREIGCTSPTSTESRSRSQGVDLGRSRAVTISISWSEE